MANMSTEEAIALFKANPLKQDCQQLCDLAALDLIPGFLIQLIQPQIKLAIARNPKTSPNFLTQLAEDDNDEVREKVAGNPHTPRIALQHLAREKNLDVRTALVKNPNLPGAALQHLADDIYESIRRAVANHPNTPGKVLLQLQKFIPGYELKSRLASAARIQNPSEEDLEELAKHRDWNVRCRVAENPHTPPNILEFLAGDEISYVRVCVAKNPGTPSHLLVKMAEDSTGQKYADKSVVPEVRIAVINNPNTPLSLVETLTRDLIRLMRQTDNCGTAQAIASNPRTPPHILQQLAGEEFRRASWVAMFRDMLEQQQYNPYGQVLAQADEATAIRGMETLPYLHPQDQDTDFYTSVLRLIVTTVDNMVDQIRLLLVKNPALLNLGMNPNCNA